MLPSIFLYKASPGGGGGHIFLHEASPGGGYRGNYINFFPGASDGACHFF